jgi:hypothetical protein
MSERGNNTTIVETPVEARGAVKGQGVSTVLVISTLGVAIIFGGLLLYYFV